MSDSPCLCVRFIHQGRGGSVRFWVTTSCQNSSDVGGGGYWHSAPESSTDVGDWDLWLHVSDKNPRALHLHPLMSSASIKEGKQSEGIVGLQSQNCSQSGLLYHEYMYPIYTKTSPTLSRHRKPNKPSTFKDSLRDLKNLNSINWFRTGFRFDKMLTNSIPITGHII